MKIRKQLLCLIFTACMLAACANTIPDPTPGAFGLPLPPVGDAAGLPDSVICTGQGQPSEVSLRTNEHVAGEMTDYAATILVYNDFACQGCAVTADALSLALELHSEDIRLVFRSFPNTSHDRSMSAAAFAEAAGLQGKFWEAHDLLFSTQSEWLAMSETDFQDWLWQQAAELGLDVDEFSEELNSEAVFGVLAENINLGTAYGGVPSVQVNDTPLPLYVSTTADFLLYLETLMIPYGRHIRNLKYDDCPPVTVDPQAGYTATLVTDKGNITIALYPDIAPFAVNNFIFLAEQDYYDHTPFFAVLEGVLARAGDPSGTGWGTPGYMFSTEISDQISFDRPGMVAMSIAAPDLVNSQFFITYAPLTYLNGQFTIFGEVVDGMEVLRQLTPRDPELNPLEPFTNQILDVILSKQ